METIHVDETALAAAARSGLRQARDDLLARYLPLVYNIVGRALDGHPDVDDVVQEIMLRAVRDLPTLRAPESFRSWLIAIAVHQISSNRQQRTTAASRTTTLDAVTDVPDRDANFESATILRVQLSEQRREVAGASRWLDADDRTLLSLWWQETASELTRTELASAMGMSVAHAGVRIQRMRTQLTLARSVVAALTAEPICPILAASIIDWDGVPSALWRKRLARHTRSCPTCARTVEGQIPVDRLLVGLTLVPVPAALTAALTANGVLTADSAAVPAITTAAVAAPYDASFPSDPAGAAKAGLIRHLWQVGTAHPLALIVTAMVLAGGTVAVSRLSEPTPRPDAVVAAPTANPSAAAPPAAASPAPVGAPTGTPTPPNAVNLPLGPASLEAVQPAGQYVAYENDLGVLSPVAAADSLETRLRATFVVARGLAEPTCFTFRTLDGRYLRHWQMRLRVSVDEGTDLFRADATFCPRAGAGAGAVVLESHNFGNFFLHHHRDGGIWLDYNGNTEAFRAESSFRLRQPWEG